MESTAITKEQKRTLWSVIAASSVGTLIEWYDFFIFGSLATILSQQFFPESNPTAALLATLATFAVGFIVRPFGAIVFGWFGDLIGRKYTFLVTLMLMGGSTFAIGLIPGYKSIGIIAPILIVLLRVIQGLALGGEYGGAATYVAEHAPAARRGFYTSFIQTTATLGFFVSIGVILLVRESMEVADFSAWGWRVPFLLSAVLVGISIYIRLRMEESPLFSKLKAEGKISKNPLRESFANKENLKMILITLFGATAGQGVVWYTGQFYALSFLQKACFVEFVQSYYIIAIALVVGTPLFIVFGSLSDRIGRKYIMMAGLLLAVLLYRPIYTKMFSLCDVSKKIEIKDSFLISNTFSVHEGSQDSVNIARKERTYTDGSKFIETVKTITNKDEKNMGIEHEVVLGLLPFWTMVGLVVLQVIFVTMVYGPIAAFLVELFPTRIRYTSMSFPYHIGNGVFGGLVPLVATSLFEASKNESMPLGDPIAGLWYPIIVAAVCFVIGMVFLRNKIKGEVME